jgi:NADPH:quinone reductase-like Zn-dependent oxidoreductase
MNVVKRGGILVSLLGQPSQERAGELGIRAIQNTVLPTSEHLRAIVQMIDEGHAKATIRRVFALHEAQEAHKHCEIGHGRGRIVLHIAN